jgi:hypothetical protein
MITRSRLAAATVATVAAFAVAGPARAAVAPPGITCTSPVAVGTQVTPYVDFGAGIVYQSDTATSQVTCVNAQSADFEVKIETDVVYWNGSVYDIVGPDCYTADSSDPIAGVAVATATVLTCHAPLGSPAIGVSRWVGTSVTVYYAGGHFSYPYVYTPLLVS